MVGRPSLVDWYQVSQGPGISEFESQLGKEGSIPSRSSYFIFLAQFLLTYYKVWLLMFTYYSWLKMKEKNI